MYKSTDREKADVLEFAWQAVQGFDLVFPTLLPQMGIHVQRFEAFIAHVEDSYSFESTIRNPYHTNIHAADVTQTGLALMMSPVLKRSLWRAVDRFSLLFSCAIHDYRHPGVNNNFLVNANDESVTSLVCKQTPLLKSSPYLVKLIALRYTHTCHCEYW